MKQLFKLAWRNIWRKRRRSVIAIVSVAFAVIISISLRSLMLGNYDKMVEAGVKNSGYIQIHFKNYWKDKSINDLIENSPQTISTISAINGITQIMPRLQNFALAAGENTSKAVIVNGIQPNEENSFTNINKRIIQGSFIKNNSKGVAISEGLAKHLKLKVNDTLVLIGQGYHATIASGKYTIEGIVKLPNPQMNLMNVYMPLPIAQEFASAQNMISAYLINLNDNKNINTIAGQLKINLGNEFEIMTWEEMLPEIKNSQKIDTTIFTMLASCLYLIIGMGLIGTILMMAIERKKEFAILQAIGLQKSQIQTVILIESVLLGIVGIILAFTITIPFILYMNANPIPLTGDSGKSFEAMGVEPSLQLGVKPYLFGLMASIVFAIMLLATLFPILFVKRLKTSEALK